MPIIADRETAMTTVLNGETDELAAAIVQTAHARIGTRIVALRVAVEAALVAFGTGARTDDYTFPADAKAILTQLASATPKVDWPVAWWIAEEAAVKGALDDANRAYQIVAQAVVTEDLPAAP